MTLTGWVVLATSPSPSPSPSPGFGPAPGDQRPGAGDATSAGLYAFLIIVVLAVALAILIWSMNRSLRRARRNLGGDVLPRRAADQLATTPEPERPER